jgi:hypothetical protein
MFLLEFRIYLGGMLKTSLLAGTRSREQAALVTMVPFKAQMRSPEGTNTNPEHYTCRNLPEYSLWQNRLPRSFIPSR